ncbi:MAG TPA: BREX-1 system phosphatase PglZ type B, partial [Gemmataceae bacterium]|nr:BREX-1 system phosphatase PglZ type B [Gemmataceae bacterium]
GLGLKLARDAATANAIRRALDRLVDVPVADLKAKSAAGQLDSQDFDALISDDLVDDLLTWLSDPKGSKERWDTNRWETLCSRCIADYGFDPASDGDLVGAEKLGLQDKPVWKTAWKRFAASPSRYLGLIELLRRARPQKTVGGLFDNERVEFWPQDNEADEADLRNALEGLSGASPAKARSRLKELDEQHKHRREWVWAKLGRAPLAQAVAHLAALAEATATALGGATTGDMIRAYTEGGWQADAAVLDALAAVTGERDRTAICAAIAQVYTPWLRDAAELFQQRVKAAPLLGKESPRLADVPAGTCVLFADGLRFDIGQKLKAALEGKVGSIQLTHHTAALPTVTPTAKPAVSPVANKISGVTAGEEFRPTVAEDEKDLTIDRFRKLLEEDGFQVLTVNETGAPEGRAWTEFGNLDKTGHAEGIGLARRIPELIAALVSRIEALLAAGWREVRVVTDHGWLLLPGGLPKTDLPRFLTATRWRRCAVVKPKATVDLPCFPWFWSDDVRIACPPGIDCFLAGEEYNHGGLSLQECVVPTLAVRPGKQAVVSAKIEQVKWAGLRCRIKVSGQFVGCKVDLRDKAADPSTSLASAKAVGDDGTVAIVVVDDRREGNATNLVLLDAAGNVIDKMPVTVGG